MTEIAQKVMEVCKLRQLAYKKTLPAVLVHQMPFLCGDHAKQFHNALGRQRTELRIQLIGIIGILLTSGKQDTLYITLTLWSLIRTA